MLPSAGSPRKAIEGLVFLKVKVLKHRTYPGMDYMSSATRFSAVPESAHLILAV